jgi:hypothetical protein
MMRPSNLGLRLVRAAVSLIAILRLAYFTAPALRGIDVLRDED